MRHELNSPNSLMVIEIVTILADRLLSIEYHIEKNLVNLLTHSQDESNWPAAYAALVQSQRLSSERRLLRRGRGCPLIPAVSQS